MPVSVVGPSSPPSFADRLNAANTNFRAAITSGDDQSVIDALRSLWELAVVIGEIGARSAFAKPTPEAAIAQKRLLDDIAGLLAKLNSALSTGSADSNNVGISTSPVFRNNADIRISLTNSVNDLKRLAQNKRADEAIDVRDVLKTFSAIQTQSSRVLSSLASEQMRSVRLNLDSETVRGVESSARNSADSARLALPGPFDSGRPCNGIDSLATRLAQMPSISEADQAKREQWETQLDTLLISLGERLRFIATNGWLASESVPVKAGGASDSRRPDESQADSVSSASQELDLGSPEGRTKALLETVGNTLLVFADDEFRRDAHAKREADGRSRESGAFEALMRFDAGGAFAEIVRRIEAEISRVSQAAGPEGAPTAAKPSDQALRDAQSVLSHWLALAVVLDKQALVTHRATIDELWAGFSVDIESVLTRVRGSLSQGNANPSLETLGQALTHETKLWSAGGLARPDAQAALTGLGSLIENLGQRTVADRTLTYAELRSRVKGDVKLAFERWTQAKKAFDLAKAADEEAAVAANTNAQTRQRAQSLVDALNAVRGAKTVFEQRMKAAMSVVSVGQAYDMVLDIVEKSQPVSDSSSARLAALRNVRASVVGGNDGMPFVVGGETRRIEVLDAYIARLRYRYLDALERRSDGVGDVEHALAAAYRMRAEMVHVRPASAYLRAMFTATGLQQDPQLRNDNMLNDTLGRLWGRRSKPARVRRNS
ncbi:MAG: hypothetical protein R3E83_07800 [Burkholderiaceae bacterium]